MLFLVKARSFLRNLFLSRRVEVDLDAEVHSHLEMLVEENIRAGMPPEEAQRAAWIELGGIEQVKEQVRERRMGNWLHSVIADCRYGARQLRKNPGFTAVAALTLALGIGANTYIFSFVDALLLRPIRFPDPSRLVALWERVPNISLDRIELAPANFLDWQAQNHVFDHIAAEDWWDANLGGVEYPEHLHGFLVTPHYFAAVEAEPMLGRAFLPEEGAPGKDHVAMLSYGLWRDHFAADPSIVGKPVLLNGIDYTVVGVMGPDYNYPSGAQIWAALAFSPQSGANRASHYLHGVAHLGAGINPQQAQAEMSAIAVRLAKQYPATNTGRDAKVMPLLESEVGQARAPLVVLLVAVGLVLAIACANISNLLLARATSRQRETAIRSALGATRRRLIRQWLVESMLLGLLGGGLGVLLAFLCLEVQVIRIPPEFARMLPGWGKIAINTPVLLFTSVISMGTGLLFGFLPALRASRPNVNDSLKEGAPSTGFGPRHRLLRNTLIVSEVALSLALLVTAGLMMKSFLRLERVSPGFNPDRLLTMFIALPDARYTSSEQTVNFYEQLIERVQNLPGVQGAAAANMLPLGGMNTTSTLRIEGRPEPAAGQEPEANFRTVTNSYFRTMQIPILRGREFTSEDSAKGQLVVAINKAFAERFWPGEDPLGKRVRFSGPLADQPWHTVVAVVGNIQDELNVPAPAEMYFPLRQQARSTMALVVRTSPDPQSLEASVRRQVAALDRDQPVFDIMTMDDLRSVTLTGWRLGGTLMAAFAGFALALAAIGLFGVIAYTVKDRTHEIAMRMALGAAPQEVLRLIVGQGMTLALIGLLAGLPLALGMGRAVAGLLYGVAPNDFATFAGVAAILAGVAFAACYIPARRAMRTDPWAALRNE
ncbi:MAG: ABC transporter permease [Terriglobia bacterium]|jgi:putative ABC transport system permease protein